MGRAAEKPLTILEDGRETHESWLKLTASIEAGVDGVLTLGSGDVEEVE